MVNPRLQPQPRPQPGPPSVSRGTWGSSALTLHKSRSASSVLLPGAGIVRVQSQRDDPRPRPRHRGGLPSSLAPVSLCGVEGTSFSLAASGSVTDPRSRDTPRAPGAAGPAAASALKWSFYTVGGPRAPPSPPWIFAKCINLLAVLCSKWGPGAGGPPRSPAVCAKRGAKRGIPSAKCEMPNAPPAPRGSPQRDTTPPQRDTTPKM